MRISTLTLGLSVVALSAFVASAAPANLVTNGGFEASSYTQNNQFGMGFGGQGVTGWTATNGYNLYEFGGTQSTTNAISQFGYTGKEYFPTVANVASPNGGNFVALDGDPKFESAISQTIKGLIVGKIYKLAFDWAGTQLRSRSGATTESLQVTLGKDLNKTTKVVKVGSQGFVGWIGQSYTFKASTTSELLNFLSIGSPSGLPPVAFLDGVSLTQNVPEPAALGLIGLGLAGLALRTRRR